MTAWPLVPVSHPHLDREIGQSKARNKENHDQGALAEVSMDQGVVGVQIGRRPHPERQSYSEAAILESHASSPSSLDDTASGDLTLSDPDTPLPSVSPAGP